MKGEDLAFLVRGDVLKVLSDSGLKEVAGKMADLRDEILYGPQLIVEFNWTRLVPTDQFDHDFIQGMLNRMNLGFHNYGHMRRQHDRPDNVKNTLIRLIRYAGLNRIETALSELKQTNISMAGTGNTEFLMDSANYNMMEFAVPTHPGAHYRPTDSHESPGSHVAGRIVKNKSELLQIPDMKRPREGD